MATDPWAGFEEVTPVTAAPAFPGVIPGRPKAAPVPTTFEIEDQDMQRRVNALDLQLKAQQLAENDRKAAEDADKAKKASGAQSNASRQLRNVLDKIDQIALDAADNGGWFETGASGKFARDFLPAGSAGYDLAANVKTVDANAAFNALAEMRANSPTGGALGSITERELELLTSSVANLDPNQSQAQFLNNLSEAKKLYLDMLDRVEPGAREEYANKPGIRFDENGTGYLTAVAGPETRPIEDRLDMDNGGPPPPAAPTPSGSGESFAGSVGDIVETVADLPGIVINPIGQALYDALGYDAKYDTGTIVRTTAGLPRNPDGLLRSVNQFGAAAMAGGLAARAAAPLASAGGTTRGVLDTLGRTPIRDTISGVGAGAGSYVGEKVGGPVGGAVGALAGGVGGYGAASAAISRTAPRQMGALMAAADRQNVELLPADAGGAVARALTTGAKASPLSVAPIVKQAARTNDQIGAAASRVARSQGDTINTDVAGQGIRNAAQRFTRETSERGSRLYDRANKAAEGVSIKPRQTIARLDEYIERVGADPSAPSGAVAELTSFRNNIAKGVKVSGLRDARTRLAQGVYDGKLRSGSEQAMWSDILGNLSSDIDLGLQAAGRGQAAAMFKRADAFWKDRVEHIDQVLQPIIGKDGMKSGEDVVRAVESMARGHTGGNQRLSRLLSNMTEAEAGQVRATVIDRIGRAKPGAQTAEGEAFSPATFLTNWAAMTPQAKASLFGDKALRRDLDDIAKLAEGMKASQAMANHSNTSIAAFSNVGTQLVIAASHPVGMALGAGAQYVTGRLLASPRFARALASSAKLPPEAASRKLGEQLGVIASREPLIAMDARGLQQFLNENAELGRAAASDEQRQDQE